MAQTTTVTARECTFNIKPYLDLGLTTTFYASSTQKIYQPTGAGLMTLPGDMNNQFNIMKNGNIEYGFQCQNGNLTVTDKNFHITTLLAGANIQTTG